MSRQERRDRIAVFGLGYVGTVSAAQLAASGHRVYGIDPNPAKVDPIVDGRTPIREPGLDALLARCVGDGSLTVSTEAWEARTARTAIVCVGTPSTAEGGVELGYLHRVVHELGALVDSGDCRLENVVVRSTVPPGTTQSVVADPLGAVVDRAGREVRVVFQPEFLREGSALADYEHPPFTVLGLSEPHDGPGAQAARGLPTVAPSAPVHVVPFEAAELLKYTTNAWHALKVTFANEVGVLARALQVDGHQVMDLLVRDTHLNTSAAYLRPGAPYGGSCLPKDVRALNRMAAAHAVDAPTLRSILSSNRAHLARAIELVSARPGDRVAILGLTFKASTDDLRESPMVAVAQAVLGVGADLRIFDPNLQLSELTGANHSYIMSELPHLARLLQPSLRAALEDADIAVLGPGCASLAELAVPLAGVPRVVDLHGHGRRLPLPLHTTSLAVPSGEPAEVQP